jgi:hypothetical protein
VKNIDSELGGNVTARMTTDAVGNREAPTPDEVPVLVVTSASPTIGHPGALNTEHDIVLSAQAQSKC